MRLFLLSTMLYLSLFAEVLPLPVKYDPFYKAQKLLKKKKKIKSVSRTLKLTLSAIYNERAYINGKFYKVGDKIEGYKIYKIGKNFVILKKRGKKRVLYLVKNKILKTMEYK
ncbi:hypothetical protein [Nitrosophilus labii]|uniref:hypothetical protein n=1 Tax=Nitrosophilus labii TaxID=2706014 RepID=UPI001656CE4F|nr:hypothetical protein [Nitrosophilus labii]